MSYSDAELEAFHKACFSGKRKLAKELLAKSSRPLINSTRSDGLAALHIAANCGSSKICKMLLKRGADLEMREKHGATPLCIAAQQGAAGVAKLLLEKGADPNAARNDGVPPLFIAAQEGRHKVCDLLIEHGANLDFARPNGATPLYIAAQKGQFKVLEVLLARGAAVDVKVEGVTPLEVAVRNGHLHSANLLIRAKGPVYASIDERIAHEDWAARLEKARGMLGEVLSAGPKTGGEEEEKKQPALVSHKVKKKEAAKLSKKELVEQYQKCAKTMRKVDRQLAGAVEELRREKEELARELMSWKAAYMLLQETIMTTGFVLPEAKSSRVIEVGQVKMDLSEDSSGNHPDHII